MKKNSTDLRNAFKFSFMRLQALTPIAIAAVLVAASSPACAYSDAQSRDLDVAGHPIRAVVADPGIEKALTTISAERIRRTIEKLVSFGNRSTLSSMETGLKPGTGINASAGWIEAELKRYAADCSGCLVVKRDTFTEDPDAGPDAHLPKPTLISNIYAVQQGTDPTQSKRMYLVTAHYDSRNSTNENTRDPAPGANDDASGVAVSLECARVLSQRKFPATLVFVAVAGEEQGLYGSRHLARLAQSQGWQLEGVLNNDIVGGNSTPGDPLQQKGLIRIFSEGVPATATSQQLRTIQTLGGENDSPSRQLARAIQDTARTYFSSVTTKSGICSENCFQQISFTPVLQFRRDRFLRGGDHTSFNQEGFAAVRLTEWREDFNHQHQDVRMENGVQYGDLIRYVDFNYVANVARLNAAALATLASAPAPPRNINIVTKELTNETALHWEADAGSHFEVLWRETSAPDWQYFLTTSENSIKVPVSKDNVILGLRAVDEAGHRSLAVVPTPEH